MKKLFLSAALFLTAMLIYSQSNEEIDAFMAKGEADLATAAYFTLAAAGMQGAAATAEDAPWYLNENNWFKEELKGDELLKASDASYLIMKAFNQKGGLWYTVAPGPRYAFKEIKYRKLIDQKTDPAKIMSGDEFMILLSEFLSWKETN
ncbi:MAG: hypothetical protein RBT69_10360 [Spirochaetia bacterium]|jgi:hypothetical protein|nr:hypothetical protein [Spirochaetia bacterium]